MTHSAPTRRSLRDLGTSVLRARWSFFVVYLVTTGFGLLIAYATQSAWAPLGLGDPVLFLDAIVERPTAVASALRSTVALAVLYALLSPLLQLIWVAELGGARPKEALTLGLSNYFRAAAMTLLLLVLLGVWLVVSGLGLALLHLLMGGAEQRTQDVVLLAVVGLVALSSTVWFALHDLCRAAVLSEPKFFRAVARGFRQLRMPQLLHYWGFLALSIAVHSLGQATTVTLTEPGIEPWLALFLGQVAVLLALAARGGWLGVTSALNPAVANRP